MIIDGDVHISPFSTGGNSIKVEQLIASMDRAGVDKAITWLQPPYTRDIKESNRYVYESSKRYDKRLLGFGWADPNLGQGDARDRIRESFEEFGFYGVKFNGAQNEFYIDDPKLMPLYEDVAKHGKMLAFHIGGDSPEHTHPFRLAKIAKAFPETNIFMVHMGGAHFHDFGNAAIEFAEDCPNLTIIGSVIRSHPLLKAIQKLGANRVCFGSDTPFEFMHVEVARYQALLENEVSDGEKKLIMGGNIAKLFGLVGSTASSLSSTG